MLALRKGGLRTIADLPKKGLPSNLAADLPPADARGYVRNGTERGPIIDEGEEEEDAMPPKGDAKDEGRRYDLGDASIDARGYVRNETSTVLDTGVGSDATLESAAAPSDNDETSEEGSDEAESASLDAAERHKAWRGIYERELESDGTQSLIVEANEEARAQLDNEANGHNIGVLDNVKEYVASDGISEGEILSGSVMKSEKGDADLETNIDLDPEQSTIPSSGTATASVDHQLTQNTSSGSADRDFMAKESNSELESDKVPSDESVVPDTSDHQPVEADGDTDRTADKDHIEEDQGVLLGHLDSDQVTKPAIPDTPSRTNVNSDFIDGIDDLHKFVEEVDPPDELDVAHGTSMQEVLVGKSVQILTKKVTTSVRHIRSVASKVKGRVANSKLVEKLREGIESSGVIGLGEKVREKMSLSEERTSKATNRSESAEGVVWKVREVIKSKIEAVQHFFVKAKENGVITKVRDLFGRIKANKIVASIMGALGLNDEEDDDDVMDFASFQRMQGSIRSSGDAAAASGGGSLEDRLAVLRAKANA